MVLQQLCFKQTFINITGLNPKRRFVSKFHKFYNIIYIHIFLNYGNLMEIVSEKLNLLFLALQKNLFNL